MTVRRIAGAAAALVTIAALALFVLDATIWAPVEVSTDAPVAPTLAAAAPDVDALGATGATEPSAAAGTPGGVSPAAAGEVRTYRLDPARSEARYEVGETFFDGNRFVVAVGRTKGVAGEIRIDPANPAASQVGEIVVDISQLTSDKERRDNFIRRNALMSSQFPEARFAVGSIDGFPADPAMDTPLTFTMTGDLMVKDVTKATTWAVTTTLTAAALTGTATTTVKMSDFGIGPIEIPMLATEDDVLIAFDFVAVPVVP